MVLREGGKTICESTDQKPLTLTRGVGEVVCAPPGQ